MGLVIGKGGEHLRLIERSFSVKINVVTQEPGSFDKERILNLVGEDSNVAKAKDTIAELIETGTMPSSLFTQFERDIATIEVPGHKVGLIIGRGGETIQSLQEKSGARIMVAADQDRSAPMKKVSIKGPPAAIEKAKELINEVLNAPSTHQSQQQDRV